VHLHRRRDASALELARQEQKRDRRDRGTGRQSNIRCELFAIASIHLMASWTDTLAALFAAHRARLEAVVTRRSGDRGAAPDLVQEAFARVLKSGSAGSAEADTRILYAVARNAAIDHRLTQVRRARALDAMVPEQLSAPAPGAEQDLAGRDALRALDAALEELSDRSKEIFILCRVQGVPQAEAARRLGISLSAVEKHLVRALRHCQARLAAHRAEDSP
jgi:RNA polymerase sigma factor (sigma-70 family)